MNKYLWLVIGTAVALSGCGNEEAKKPATQVAAKVNKQEISVHQINRLVGNIPNLNPDQVKVVGKQVLERLIEQELLVQQALAKKLDRDPNTLQALEAARREILARAYLERSAGSAASPSAQEIKDYYQKHPELFSQRRVYNFQQLVIPPDAETLAKVQAFSDKAGSLKAIADKLKAEKIRFMVSNTTKTADQLPLDLLSKFHQMQDGQLGMIAGRDATLVFQLMASRSIPMTEADATPLIKQYLTEQKRREASSSEIKALRAKAEIDYVGDYAKAESKEVAAAAEGAATPDTKVGNAAGAQPAAPAQNPDIEKGLRNLR